jgi:hypothetical protein
MLYAMWEPRAWIWAACLALTAVLASAIALAQASPQDAAGEVGQFVDEVNGPFRVYLAPTGSDANSGLSPTSAVHTLGRAQAVLQEAAPTTDVEVRIEQGTYAAPPTAWTFLVPGRTVTFLPIDYEYGERSSDIAGRPVFRGDGTSGFWLTARLPEGHAGSNSGLRFYYLHVEQYDLGGVKIDGGVTTVGGIRRPATGGHNGNTIFGMYFTKLGSRWAGPGFGYGGIDLINSRNNLIQNNHFTHIENTGSDAGLIHGLYLAHHSASNTISSNQFEMISGDAIRTRNDSNDNDVFYNVFRRTGKDAQFSDWLCDTACAEQHSTSRDCASHGNVFRENDNVSGYSGGEISDWHLFQGDLHYAGRKGCSNDGQERVRTWGNA